MPAPANWKPSIVSRTATIPSNRAATVGDGWHPLALRPPGLLLPDEFAAKVALFRSTAERAGRNPDTLTLSLRVGMAVRSSRDKAPGGDRSLFQGTAAEVLEDINRYAALGVSHFVFDPVVPDLKLVLASMDRFANDVRPKVVSKQKKAVGSVRRRSGRA